MNSLLSELRSGKYRYVGSDSDDNIALDQYLTTESNKNIFVGTGIASGTMVFVSQVRQSWFMAWRIKRALRKGSLK